MRVEGTYIFPGATGDVFALLTNPDALARAIPGCERFIQFGPASDDGQTAYEARLRLGQRRQAYVVTARVAATREPDYLKLEVRGYGPSGPLSGEGSLDLVEQDGHTVVAYRLSLTGPDLAGAMDASSVEGARMARATCAHLADELQARSGGGHAQYAAAALAEDAARREVARMSGTPSWPERAVWMGTGLALGLGVIAVSVALARRLIGFDSAVR